MPFACGYARRRRDAHRRLARGRARRASPRSTSTCARTSTSRSATSAPMAAAVLAGVASRMEDDGRLAAAREAGVPRARPADGFEERGTPFVERAARCARSAARRPSVASERRSRRRLGGDDRPRARGERGTQLVGGRGRAADRSLGEDPAAVVAADDRAGLDERAQGERDRRALGADEAPERPWVRRSGTTTPSGVTLPHRSARCDRSAKIAARRAAAAPRAACRTAR